MTDETPNPLILAATVLVEKAARFIAISSEGEVALAGEFRARANEQAKQLDAERLKATEPLRKEIEAINLRYNAPIQALKERLGVVDKAILTYQREQRELAEAANRMRIEEENRRQAEIEAARKAAEAAGEPPPPEPEPLPVVYDIPAPSKTITGTYGSKVGTRENWKYRIVDIKKVPEQYLVPPEDRVNKSILNAHARSTKGTVPIKGLEFFCEESLSSRVG